ncbi:5'-methylthioadenosine/adenosylhomocysteine nucleosidase [Aerococcaceae bacterium zg-ZJ1578]|uniref:5'-methylthioadenosine/adenosylhomocysteine nucleosidase n=1 Tax=Aerococcaceae bacterium zg-252 TaxID=2796928 RepID=UPI001A347401|nr:5'-methylthioadenosine/adenosylhomocysteine nucleosidase [Aerococcaceae bacterium zg-1578]
MKIGIIGAMEEEIRSLKLAIQESAEQVLYQQSFIVGKLGAHEVVLVQSGIGKVNASIITTLLVQHFAVDMIINTGTAGALHSGLKVGSVVIADRLSHHDVDVTGFGYEKGQMAGMPAYYYSDSDYLRVAKQACRLLDIEPALGLIVSGDAFVNHADKVKAIKADFPKALACEMESAAIAQTAHVLGVPFVIIRAISDSADEVATMSFDEFVIEAGRVSAQMVQRFVEILV